MNLQSMKKLLRRIFFLPPVPTLLISVPSYGLVIYAWAALVSMLSLETAMHAFYEAATAYQTGKGDVIW